MHLPRTNATSTSLVRSGFTAVELSVMSALLLIGLLAFSSSVKNALDLGETSHESALAVEAARRAVEGLGAVEFSDLFAEFNTDPADDPGGPGTGRGAHFDVDGLVPRADDAAPLAEPGGFRGNAAVM